jgi:predicted neuraminidase
MADASARDDSMIVKSEFIYDHAPFPACHASTIVESQGELVAAWFGGSAESHPDVCIYVSRYERDHWTPPAQAADGVVSASKRYACYNPVLFQPKKGPLLLFYKVGPGPQRWFGMMTESSDGGRTWGKPHRLPKGIFGPIKNKPIELEDGTILCPSSNELGGWAVHFESTKDLGRTWRSTPPLNDPMTIGAIQPSILRLSGHRLRAIGRTQQSKLFAIDSDDNGKSWGPMRLIDLPNPNSGIDAVTLRDGRQLLVYNHSTTQRTPLNVAISSNGEHWQDIVTLEDQPGEYSYPAVIQTHDGLVHITYTWQRTHIKHVVIDPR